MQRHRKQEWEFLRTQLDDQRDILRKHMEIMQAAQMKQLEAAHDQVLKEMNARQARISVETIKEVRADIIDFKNKFSSCSISLFWY